MRDNHDENDGDSAAARSPHISTPYARRWLIYAYATQHARVVSRDLRVDVSDTVMYATL